MKKFLMVLMLMTFVISTVLVANTRTVEVTYETKIEIAYVNWAEGIAMTYLAQAILEDYFDMEVETTMADAGLVFASIATGDRDVFLDAWLPVTHKAYMDRFKDSIEDLGFNFRGARIGAVVPSYVEANSLEEINNYVDEFNGEIIGIDAGAGIMQATNRAIEAYDLDFRLVSSSGPAMTAALDDAISRGNWIIVTGWEPHWKFARYDLKFLNDPEKTYGEVEYIKTVARDGFSKDNPIAAEFFKNFFLTSEELGSLMGMIADSNDSNVEVARRWIEDNKELVEFWVPEFMK